MKDHSHIMCVAVPENIEGIGCQVRYDHPHDMLVFLFDQNHDEHGNSPRNRIVFHENSLDDVIAGLMLARHLINERRRGH